MKYLKKILLKFFGVFRLIEENSQLNIIKSIETGENGTRTIKIGPLHNEDSASFSAFEILSDRTISNFLSKNDLEIVKIIATCEGDIFVMSKFFSDTGEILKLSSITTKENWVINLEDIEKQNNGHILKRLNRKYFTHALKKSEI